MLLSHKYEESNSPYSWEHFVMTHFVDSCLTASSVIISSFLENPIAKRSKHDGALSMVSSFRPEPLSYIADLSIVLFSQMFPIELHHMCFKYLKQKNAVSLAHVLVAGQELFVCGLAVKKSCLLNNDERFRKGLG